MPQFSLPELPAPPRRRRWGRVLLLLLLFVAFGIAAAGGVVLILFGHVADAYDLARLGQMKQRSIVLDCKGREIGRLHGENRVVVPLSQVSRNFTNALLAREDSRFYDHGGIDYIGVARAILRDLKESKAMQGASTLTMQLARNSFDDLNAKTMHRKIVEVMLARRIEASKTKDEILELYVNRIFFGSGLYGIERASKAYFGKGAGELSRGEGAMLAGIIRSPNRFSPFRNWQGALAERNTVLDRMVLKKYITQAEADAAKQEEIAVAAQPVIHTQENYMMEAVRRDLDLVLDEQEVEDGGLIIHTTLDRDLQSAAEQSLEKRLREVESKPGYPHATKAKFDAQWDGVTEPPRTPYLQGAVLALDNRTGGILAVVGGRDYRQSRYDRALQAGRQIGSTIKPFIYAAAFMRGLLPGTMVEDAPIRPGELTGYNGLWSPENSDGKFLGFVPAAVGLIHSRNAMTVRVGNYAGMDTVLGLLRDAGLGTVENVSPQIYIGNTGATLKALVGAMTIFPNHGVRRRPYLIQRIQSEPGALIYSTPVLESDVLPPAVAQITGRLLERVMSEGTAASARSELGFKEKAGGKTGTTNDFKDAWFAGYTREVTCGVWVGFDTPQTILEGGYGAKLSLPIWVDVMNSALAHDYKSDVPAAGQMIARTTICRVSGRLATSACAAQGEAYNEDLPLELVPHDYCTVHNGTGSEENRGEKKPGFFGRIFKWFK